MPGLGAAVATGAGAALADRRKPGALIGKAAEPRAMTALAVNASQQVVRRPARHRRASTSAVEPGERRLIIGPNGAGKTTLFNLITGEIAPDCGSICLFGQDITRVPSRRRAASRHGAHLSDHHAVPARHHPAQRHAGAARPVAAALEPASSTSTSSTTWSTRPREALARVGLAHLADRPLSQTSYGERRRVEIAMALAQNPKVLLLDEPFAGLSIDERRDVQKLLLAIPRDVTIVMIEHNMDVALEFAERITLLHFGEVIVEGTRAEVVADPRTREVYLGD